MVKYTKVVLINSVAIDHYVHDSTIGTSNAPLRGVNSLFLVYLSLRRIYSIRRTHTFFLPCGVFIPLLSRLFLRNIVLEPRCAAITAPSTPVAAVA